MPALKMGTVCLSETLVSTYESTRRQNPEEEEEQQQQQHILKFCSIIRNQIRGQAGQAFHHENWTRLFNPNRINFTLPLCPVSETSVYSQETTRRNSLEKHKVYPQRRENRKSLPFIVIMSIF
jgi:hypothetical protein